MRRSQGFIILLSLVLALGLAIGSPLAAQAASNDGNVEWNGLGHNPMENICSSGQIPYRSPIPAGSGEEVVVRARAYRFDLTGVNFWYTTNPAPTEQTDWTYAVAKFEKDCGESYAMWTATLPAPTSMLRY